VKKLFKFIMRLINKVGGSLPSLKNGVKNLLVIGEIDKVGLITGLSTKPLMWPLCLGLNLTLFLGAKI